MALILALGGLACPVHASPDWAAQRPPARIFLERPVDALGASFAAQLGAPRAPLAAAPAQWLPEPDGSALLLSGLGLLAYLARRRGQARAR